MSSDIQSTFITAAAIDADGISVAAAVGNNANLVLGGALTSGGAVTFDEPRNITILSAGDDSSKSFTVTGTDEQGDAVTESITGANADTATGSTFFTTISQIAAVGNPAGAIRMQFNTVASANTTQYPDVPDDGILCVGGGYVTYSVAGLSSMTVFYEG